MDATTKKKSRSLLAGADGVVLVKKYLVNTTPSARSKVASRFLFARIHPSSSEEGSSWVCKALIKLSEFKLTHSHFFTSSRSNHGRAILFEANFSRGGKTMAMDPAWVIDRLESNVSVFQGQLRLVRSVQASWKPAPDEWSLVEVVNHLAEEEVDDFRLRLRSLLENPFREWPNIDPERSVVERRFNSRDLQESLHRFTRERARSVEWLRTLPPVNWQVAHNHPKLGSLRAGDLLCSWLAHDFIHIRQINSLHYEYQANTSPEYSTAYGGTW